MIIELKPTDGWKSFDLHLDASDFIYAQYDEILKFAGWKYLNITSDTAVLESPMGSTVYLEFSQSNTENHDRIQKMLFEYSNSSDSLILHLEQGLTTKFQLKRIVKK